MLDLPDVLLRFLRKRLWQESHRHLGRAAKDMRPALDVATRLAVERLATSDALYHNVEHTVNVTLVGLDILRGRDLAEAIDAEEWLHFCVALLLHDIGYVRGILKGDCNDHCVVDGKGTLVSVPRGASDAWLTPYHVERGKQFIRERSSAIGPQIDPERVAAAIELTRFPVPEDEDHADTTGEAGLLRAADLIGQLADPYYLRRHGALFAEFVETGTAAKLGYKTTADLAESYPAFFWLNVEPYLGPALTHLKRTASGRQWVANLYAHIFEVERDCAMMGPLS